MNNPQEILIELIEGQDSQGISELLEQHPDLERDYKAYSEIIKAFKAMRVDQLSQKLESDQTISFEDDLQKGMQAMKVEALTEKLKLHDTKEKTTSSRIIRLNTRILSIAASFLILVSVAFWVFNDSASALGVEDVAQQVAHGHAQAAQQLPYVDRVAERQFLVAGALGKSFETHLSPRLRRMSSPAR